MTDWNVQPTPELVGEPIKSVNEPLYQPREQVIRTPRRGGHGQLAGSSATLYTAPTPALAPTGSDYATSMVMWLSLHNEDASSRTATIHIVESGGSVGDNREHYVISLAANETVMIEFGDKGLPLHAGDTVRGTGSAADTITYYISVEELTL